MIVADFLRNSWPCVESMVSKFPAFAGERRPAAKFFTFREGKRADVSYGDGHFFLRGSVEYSNPHLTVEEVQGIIAVRLLEVCGNHFHQYGMHEVDARDIDEICEVLKKPPQGIIVPFLLNTDDTEPDRYSMNPLKESIVTSGQSAFPSASVRTERLEVDKHFVEKYEGALISRAEVEMINRHLGTCSGVYVDLSDAVKYEQLRNLSEPFGIDLCVPSLRLPIQALAEETSDGLLHHIISEVHADYHSVETAYACMGRSMKNRTTLLTVPHSTKGYGSKRSARGKLYFDDEKLKSVRVSYQTTPLYANAIDPSDVSIARAEETFTLEGEKLTHYNFKDTPSSPQFSLYSLASPEDAALWHGIGAFGATQLLGSYTNVRVACAKDLMIRSLKEKFGIQTRVPLQFNLVPKYIWFHPVHRNIDASVGCVENLRSLAEIGMKVEYLSSFERTL